MAVGFCSVCWRIATSSRWSLLWSSYCLRPTGAVIRSENGLFLFHNPIGICAIENTHGWFFFETEKLDWFFGENIFSLEILLYMFSPSIWGHAGLKKSFDPMSRPKKSNVGDFRGKPSVIPIEVHHLSYSLKVLFLDRHVYRLHISYIIHMDGEVFFIYKHIYVCSHLFPTVAVVLISTVLLVIWASSCLLFWGDDIGSPQLWDLCDAGHLRLWDWGACQFPANSTREKETWRITFV